MAGPNLNQRVASELVNMTDFAHTFEGGPAPLPVYLDDEGTVAVDDVLIRDGILTGYMNDRESAAEYGMTPTGNARGWTFADEPIIRMRNTCILPGKNTVEELIASVDDGYYLIDSGNGQADLTGEFMFGVTCGYEIKNGKLGKALLDTTVTGIAFDMLKTVDMVSDKVEIITKSYKDGAVAQHWTCDGSPEFTLEDTEKADRGTDIILHISDDCKEYLDKVKITELLTKYCRFMPVPIAFGKKTEWKDGKEQETNEDNIINNIEPLWTKAPSSLKDEDYKKFYRELYPMQDEPMFWIHLNVDYPFHLTGILYFPRVHTNIDLQRNKIQLYCNQVFVTDQVEGIVPDFLTLLHGVIDSPDIPLNVSRSYLQSDANVKKISTYITKKVADRLQQTFKDDRKDYEKKWDDLKLFINYGMLSQEDFYDRAKEFALFKDVDGKYFTFDEYKTLIKDNQTDKDGNLIYLYATNKEEQYTYIKAAQDKGYSVVLLDGQLDVPMVSMLEQKFEKSRFSRVDADIIDRLIVKADAKKEEMEKDDRDKLTEVFRSQMPQGQKANYAVDVQALGETTAPVVITQSEYMRRMKEMSKFQPGMSFYNQMPARERGTR